MDVENPLHNDDIPVAKLVFIEVMGLPMEETTREIDTIVIVVENYCCKYICKTFTYVCSFVGCIVCFGGFFIFITGFPFAYY